MEIKISSRELTFGILGAILSGFIVWLLSYGVEKNAEAVALSTLVNPLIEAERSSLKARQDSDAALESAEKALNAANEAESTAKRVQATIDANISLSSLDKKMGDLREVAKSEAARLAKIELQKLKPSFKIFPSINTKKNEKIELGVWDFCGLITAGESHSNQACTCIAQPNKNGHWSLSVALDASVNGRCNCRAACFSASANG